MRMSNQDAEDISKIVLALDQEELIITLSEINIMEITPKIEVILEGLLTDEAGNLVVRLLLATDFYNYIDNLKDKYTKLADKDIVILLTLAGHAFTILETCNLLRNK